MTLRVNYQGQSTWSAIVVLKIKSINAKTSLRVLRRTCTDALLKTIIPRNTDIRAAHFYRQDIFTYAPQPKSAQAYQRLLVELFPQ